MRAIAIFGPSASPRELMPFTRAGALVSREQSIRRDADAVLIFGGDGTINRHLPQIVEHNIPLLVVPIGSGNDFARALGIRSPKDAARRWQHFVTAQDNVRHVDLGVIRDAAGCESFFCNVGGAGLDSATNALANKMSPWLRAHGGYAIAALPALARWKPIPIRAELPDRTIDEPATMVVFANTQTYGDGMKIAPRAQLDDGLLDVCFVRRASRKRIIRKFPSIYSGTHLGIPEVEYAQVSMVRIETSPSIDVYADGEYICKTPCDVSLRPRALRVIV